MVRCQGYGPAGIQPHMVASVNANKWCSSCLKAYHDTHPTNVFDAWRLSFRKDFYGDPLHAHIEREGFVEGWFDKMYRVLESEGRVPAELQKKKDRRAAAVLVYTKRRSDIGGIDGEIKTREEQIAEITERLRKRRESGPRDSSGRTVYDRTSVDNKAWMNAELRAATEWAAELEQLGLTEQAASTIANIEAKIDKHNRGERVEWIGGDFNTFSRLAEAIIMEVKMVQAGAKSVDLRPAQGRKALSDLSKYAVAFVTFGEPVRFAVGPEELYISAVPVTTTAYKAHILEKTPA